MSRKTRNLIWPAPLVAVFAIVGALAIFAALAPNDAAAQANTAPGQPGTLSAMAFDAGIPEEQIQLEWSAPSSGGPPTHYRIDVSANGGYTWTALQSTITGSEYRHTGLKAGQTFHYRVFAYNGQLISPMSNVVSASTDQVQKPDKPENLTATVGPDSDTNDIADNAAELTITLGWTAPQDPPGAPVLGYVIQYALHDSPGAWTQLKDAGDVTTETHEKLDAGRGYRYRIAAYNQTMKVGDKVVPNPSYQSDWSLSASASTLPGALPGPVTETRAGVSPAEVKVFLFWTPPVDPLGDPITDYVVEGRPTTDAAGVELVGTNPEFQVIKNNIGRNTPITTDNTEDRYIDSFEVTQRDVNANTTFDASFTITASWDYRIAAKNRAASRTGSPDLAYATVSVGGRPDTSTAPLGPTNLNVIPSDDNEGRTGLKLTWGTAKAVNTAETPASSYRIEYSDTGPNDQEGYQWKELDADVTADTTDNPPSQTFTNDAATPSDVDVADRLAASQTRHYRVFASDGTVTSWPSDQRAGTTAIPKKPNPPTNLTTTPAGHTSVKLMWAAPDGPNDPADDLDGSEEGPSVIVGYYIQYLDEGSTSWSYLKNKDGGNLVSSEGTEHTDTGLAPGTSREYRVAAVNKIRNAEQPSDWTNPLTGRTVPIPIPNAASGLVAEPRGQSSIFLSWLAQAEQPKDAEVTGYLIQHSPTGDANTWQDLATVAAKMDDSVHTVYTDTMGLSAGTERHYRVFAVNNKGRSDQFVTANAKTDPATVPGMPTVVTAMETSDTEITVTWGSPASDGGADITGYMVQRAYMGADNMMSEWMDVDPAHMGMDMEYMDTGLMPETAYYYRVAAMNSVDMGEYSDGMAMATTEATDTAPGVPTVVTAMETSDTEITVTWGSPASDGGADITGYMVQRAYMGADNMMSEWMDVDPAHMGMDMEYMDTGLMPETAYYYRVAAMNSVDMGEYSDGMAMAMTLATVTELTAPSGVVVSTLANTQSVSVTWDTTSIQNAEQIKVVLYNSDVTALAQIAMPLITINPANDAGSATFNNVPDGTYYVTVASFRTGERHKLSPLQEVTVE